MGVEKVDIIGEVKVGGAKVYLSLEEDIWGGEGGLAEVGVVVVDPNDGVLRSGEEESIGDSGDLLEIFEAEVDCSDFFEGFGLEIHNSENCFSEDSEQKYFGSQVDEDLILERGEIDSALV